MAQVDSGFQQILDAAKEKRGDLAVDTMIVVLAPGSDADVYLASWY